MVKITKIQRREGEKFLTVWTDAVAKVGFNFDIDELTTEEDLKDKVRDRVSKSLDEKDREADLTEKAETFKVLIGQEI